MDLNNPNKVVQLLDMLFLGSASGAGAIAWHAWLGTEVTFKRVVALFVISGLFAVIVYLWTWSMMATDPTKHIAVSILCGIGATDLAAFTIALVRMRIAGAIGVTQNDDNKTGD